MPAGGNGDVDSVIRLSDGPRPSPYAYLPAAGQALALGGLWEVWHDAEGGRLATCTIVTTAPNALAAEVHDRMPLILPAEVWDRWLEPTPLDANEGAALLVPAADGVIEARKISDQVNNVRNDSPDLLAPVSI